MAIDTGELPIINLDGYINPKSPADKERVIAEVRHACNKYGFFQVKGHGIPLSAQEGLIRGLGNLFHQPEEEKAKLSFLKNPGRRGYEASGVGGLRAGDALHDSKEVHSCFDQYFRMLIVRPGLLHWPGGSSIGATGILRSQRLAQPS